MADSLPMASLWWEVPNRKGQPLDTDLRVDVCVVGAGIAGLSTAYLLAREGKRVAVLESKGIGEGETGNTTAHLTHAIDDRFIEIERMHGEEGSRICAESHTAAIEMIELVVIEEKIDCDFRRVDGYLIQAGGEDSVSLVDELEAAHRAGLRDVELLPATPLEGFSSIPSLHFPNQGQFHPLKYLNALVDAITRLGGSVHTGAHVVEVVSGMPATVKTSDGRAVTADAVVVATNSPINNMFAIHTKQAPYRTYAIGARVPRGSVPPGLYWDTLDPYHYVRLAAVDDLEHELLIVGGEDRKPGDDEDTEGRFTQLERWARLYFPMMGEIEYRWTGQVMEPVDGVAFIGRNAADDDNIYVATGDSGMGMTHGTIAGILITDLVMGRENPWAKLYDPSRITLRAAGTFLSEGADVVATMAEWMTAGDVESVDGIQPESGAIIRRGLTKLAVYRDAEGTLHERSAACTHLGCVVAWNPNEKSWDCPCHGSRFDAHGKVISGPAVEDLKKAESEE